MLTASLFLLLLFLAGSSSAQGEIGCYVSGQCGEGSFTLGISELPSPQECLEYCQQTSGCEYFTHFGGDNVCFARRSCEDFNQNCSNCISGDVTSCGQEPVDPPAGCDLVGRCEGTLVNYHIDTTRDQCILFCQSWGTCEFWSHDGASGLCQLYQGCPSLDQDQCPACVSGQRECPYAAETLFIAGGYGANDYVDTVEVIDVTGNTGSCPQPRGLPSARSDAVLAQHLGDPVICGGEPGTRECLKYDTIGDRWDHFADMIQRRAYPNVVQRNGGDFWISGGRDGNNFFSTSETYVSSEGAFVAGPPIPRAVYEHCSVRLNETHAVITGGDEFGTKVRNAYIFNMETGDYEELPRMNLARAGHGCGIAIQAFTNLPLLVVAGGTTSAENNRMTEILVLYQDGNKREWQEGSQLPNPKTFISSVQYRDSFLLLGGQDGTGLFYRDILEFDRQSLDWTTRPERLSERKGYMATTALIQGYFDCQN